MSKNLISALGGQSVKYGISSLIFNKSLSNLAILLILRPSSVFSGLDGFYNFYNYLLKLKAEANN